MTLWCTRVYVSSYYYLPQNNKHLRLETCSNISPSLSFIHSLLTETSRTAHFIFIQLQNCVHDTQKKTL